MKKKYISPVCTTISICSPYLLNSSGNRYWSEGQIDQGLIHFEEDEVDAGDGD